MFSTALVSPQFIFLKVNHSEENIYCSFRHYIFYLPHLLQGIKTNTFHMKVFLACNESEYSLRLSMSDTHHTNRHKEY